MLELQLEAGESLDRANALMGAAPLPRFEGTSKGVLAGRHLQPREVNQGLAAAGFKGRDLVIAAAVCGAESWFMTRAHNDNLDAQGNVTSRDVGLMEINISASNIGTEIEEDLYDPANNFAAAYLLYSHRGFQPWVAYNSNVYLHDTYVMWALLGCVNVEAYAFKQAAIAAGLTPKFTAPLISLKEARVMFPGIPLG